MISNYTNPHQHKLWGSVCFSSSCETDCCDGFNQHSFSCNDGCDSFFTCCLRNINTLTAGCPDLDGNTTRSSAVNPNDAPIDFSQDTVLGLENPLIFQGINHTWNVSIIPYRSGPCSTSANYWLFSVPIIILYRESSYMSKLGIRMI